VEPPAAGCLFIIAVRDGSPVGSRNDAVSFDRRRPERGGNTVPLHAAKSEIRAVQPFKPVIAMPWMKYFWAKKKTSRGTSVTRNDTAIISFQATVNLSFATRS
jgi:hypothetical protein